MRSALLTTMNSKVKVHVDGSKCVLGCRHDREEPGPRRPSVLGCSGSRLAFLSKTKQGLGLGQEYEAGGDTQTVRGRGAEPPPAAPRWRERFWIVPRGASSKKPASVPLLWCAREAACLCADVMAWFAEQAAERSKLELESRHDGVWRRVAGGDGERHRTCPEGF